MESRKLKCKFTRQLFKKAWSGRDLEKTKSLIIKHLAVIWAVADIISEKKVYDLKKR